MFEDNRREHDASGKTQGTRIEANQVGITNHPEEEAERQAKVVPPAETPDRRSDEVDR